jgi:sporulation protein YlmC with PRC-barrel domain
MLNTIRNIKYKSKINVSLNEDDSLYNNQGNDITVINDVDVNISSTDKSDLSLNDEEKSTISQTIDNFMTQVSQIVEFDPGITINEKQIRLDGRLTDEDINFVFIAGDERGLYINADMLKLEQETLQTLDKLIKYNESFKTSMESLINQRQRNLETDKKNDV